MILIIFVFDPLAIAMVIAANMAFANIKGIARDPKDYEVYQETLYTDDDEKRMEIIGQNGNEGLHYEEPKIIEKIVEVPIEVEVKLPAELRGVVEEAAKHARRRGEKVPDNLGRFFK
jgi:hypothetical protein